MRGQTNASDVPSKITSDYAQRVTYWRMPSISNWSGIYTNNTDNFMVGWLTLQASGSSGNWQFLIGGGNYNQTVPLTDGVPVFLPIAIPPHTTFNYISAPFVNGWATLFELKLA